MNRRTTIIWIHGFVYHYYVYYTLQVPGEEREVEKSLIFESGRIDPSSRRPAVSDRSREPYPTIGVFPAKRTLYGTVRVLVPR